MAAHCWWLEIRTGRSPDGYRDAAATVAAKLVPGAGRRNEFRKDHF